MSDIKAVFYLCSSSSFVRLNIIVKYTNAHEQLLFINMTIIETEWFSTFSCLEKKYRLRYFIADVVCYFMSQTFNDETSHLNAIWCHAYRSLACEIIIFY